MSGIKGAKLPRFVANKKSHGAHSFMFMDRQGVVLARHSGPLQLKYFQRAGRRARETLDLREAAGRGDQDAIVDALIRSVELLHLPPSKARGKLTQMKLTPSNRSLALLLLDLHEERKPVVSVRASLDALPLTVSRRTKIESRLLDAEAKELLRLRRFPAGKQKRADASASLLEMYRAGREPVTESISWKFWMALLERAETSKDPVLLEKAITALASYRQAYSHLPAVVEFFKLKEATLGNMTR